VVAGFYTASERMLSLRALTAVSPLHNLPLLLNFSPILTEVM